MFPIDTLKTNWQLRCRIASANDRGACDGPEIEKLARALFGSEHICLEVSSSRNLALNVPRHGRKKNLLHPLLALLRRPSVLSQTSASHSMVFTQHRVGLRSKQSCGVGPVRPLPLAIALNIKAPPFAHVLSQVVATGITTTNGNHA